MKGKSMYRVAVISSDEIFVKRLEEYWNNHCGSEIQMEITNNYESDKYDLILCDGDAGVEGNYKYVTLVSDIKQVNEPWSLPKYGRPQEMYDKIINICKDDSFKSQKLMELTEIMIGREKVLKYSTKNKAIDSYALDVLKKCPIDGLISLYEVNENEILYYIHGKISLREFINKGRDEQTRIEIIKDIMDIIVKINEYMLIEGNLILDIDYIYIHQLTGKPSLIYIPEITSDKSWTKAYQKIMTQLSELNKPYSRKVTEINGANSKEPFVVNETLNYNGRTEYFPKLQRTIGEKNTSTKRKNVSLFWKRTQKEIEVDRKIFKIGKEKKYVDFCIFDNPAVSRNHADLILQEDDVFIIDKNSLNHTYVNGKQLYANIKTQLKNHDEIRIADEEFIISI